LKIYKDIMTTKELTKKEIKFISTLKSSDILERKPNLKLCSNHFKPVRTITRYWNSEKMGTAIRDENGWYKQENKNAK